MRYNLTPQDERAAYCLVVLTCWPPCPPRASMPALEQGWISLALVCEGGHAVQHQWARQTSSQHVRHISNTLLADVSMAGNRNLEFGLDQACECGH